MGESFVHISNLPLKNRVKRCNPFLNVNFAFENCQFILALIGKIGELNVNYHETSCLLLHPPKICHTPDTTHGLLASILNLLYSDIPMFL